MKLGGRAILDRHIGLANCHSGAKAKRSDRILWYALKREAIGR